MSEAIAEPATVAVAAGLLSEARSNLHQAVAESGNRRRMFAHHAASLAADVALTPGVEAAQQRTAQCYLAEAQGLMAAAKAEMSRSEIDGRVAPGT